MKRAIFAAVLALALPAFASPCISLDYQEMKDMSVDDLVAEACKAQQAGEASFQQVMLNLEVKRGAVPYPNAQADAEQCTGQRDRMTRALKAKGVTETLPKLCEQHAHEQVGPKPASTN
jgi:hypothetical protein